MRVPEPSELVTIRSLPDGQAQPARIAAQTPDRMTVALGDEGSGPEIGATVEIDAPEFIYLGEIVGRQAGSGVIVAVEHFVDRAGLDEIQNAWKTAEGP